MQATVSFSYRQPRWSPMTARLRTCIVARNWADDVYVAWQRAAPRAGNRRQHADSGLTGCRMAPSVTASAVASTVLYLPTMHLWTISPRAETCVSLPLAKLEMKIQMSIATDESCQPQAHASSTFGSFGRRRSAENVRRALRITHQTGQVQLPASSPMTANGVPIRQRRTWQPVDHEIGNRRDPSNHL